MALALTQATTRRLPAGRRLRRLVRPALLAMVVAAWTMAGGAALAGDAKRPAPGRHLLGDELVSALSDTTHYGYSTFGPDRWVEYYGEDGTSIYKHGDETLFGIWETTFDSICFTYDDGREPQTHIFRVFFDGKKYYFVGSDENGDSEVINIADRVEAGKASDLPAPDRNGRSAAELRKSIECFPGQDA